MQPMKIRHSLPVLFLLFFALSFYSGSRHPAIAMGRKAPASIHLGEYLYTVPIRKQMGVGPAMTDWWHEYLEYPVNEKLLTPLINGIMNGKIKVYKPSFPFLTPMSKDDIDSVFVFRDSSAYETWDDNGSGIGYNKYEIPVVAKKIVSITFDEDWSYDPKALSLTKKVKGMLLHYVMNEREYNTPAKTLCYIPFNGNAVIPADNVHALTYDLNLDLVPFDHNIVGAVMGFSDTALQRERTGLAQITASLRNSVLNSKRMVCDTIYPNDHPLAPDEITARMNLINSGNNVRFMEDWGMDLSTMTFVKKIHGLELTRLTVRDTVEEGVDVKRKKIRQCAYFPSDPGQLVHMNLDFSVDSFSTLQQFPEKILITEYPLNNVKEEALRHFAWTVVNKAKNGAIKTYGCELEPATDDPWSSFRHLLSTDQLQYRISIVDSTPNLKAGSEIAYSYNVSATPMDSTYLRGFRFCESFSYDETTNTFVKNVRTIGLLESAAFAVHPQEYGIACMFDFDPVAVKDPSQIMQPQFLVASDIQSTYRMNENEIGGYSDYGSEDVGGYLVDYSGSVENTVLPSQRYAFFNSIINQIDSGKLKAYDPANDGKAMTADEVHTRVRSIVENYSGGSDELRFDYTAFNEITFTEDWYYDPATNSFYKKVKSATFVHRSDQNGNEFENVWGRQEGFTVKFN
ncbi:MAG TPA: hypothetical protein VL651_16760 [Bacteroidia bacterium]|jgi:hypothetical protein|nr:hypothetical protein [Bacteroidia bacterium]